MATKLRIVQTGPKKYIVQRKVCFFFWISMFSSAWSDSPIEFSSAEEAMDRIEELLPEWRHKAVVIKELVI